MKVDLRYPLVVRHLPEGLFAERYKACSKVATVDIAEIDADIAPVVVEWTPVGKGSGDGSRFRMHDNRIMSAIISNRTRHCRYDDSFPCAPLVAEARDILHAIVCEKGQNSVPSVKRVADPTGWQDITERLPRQCNLEDLRRWEDKFLDLTYGMIAVDGELWRPSAEPLICVHRNGYGWHASIVTTQELGQDMMRLHFTVDRWDEAREACERLAQGQGRAAAAATFFHDSAYAPGRNADFTDMLMIAARVAAIISDTTSQRARMTGSFGWSKPKCSWNDLPAELFEAYAAIRRLVDASPEAAEEQLASAAADAMEAVVAITQRKGMKWLLPQAESVQAHVDKWNSRPITLSPRAVSVPTRGYGM